MRALIFAALTTILISNTNAADAFLANGILSIPVTQVDNLFYYLEFEVIPQTAPARMRLRTARELSDPNTIGASRYGEIPNKLLIRKILLGSDTYRAVFDLVSSAPIEFELENAYLTGSTNIGVLDNSDNQSLTPTIEDADGDGIPNARDAYPTIADSLYLDDSQRFEIDLILNRMASNQIDPVTGCGYREGFANQRGPGGSYTRYPDGVMRRLPKSGDSWFVLASREGSNEKTVQYWADWLEYSPDVEEMKTRYWETVVKPDIQASIDEHTYALTLSDDDEYCAYWQGCNNQTADEHRNFFAKIFDSLKQKLAVLYPESHGYDTLTTDGKPIFLRESSLPQDVGYWTFNEDGTNSIENGAKFLFSGAIGQGDIEFDNGRLFVPKTEADITYGGEVYFDDPALSRDAFTLAFSFRNGSLPTQAGVDPELLRNASQEELEENDYLLSPRQLLLSAGSLYRWLHVNLNEQCKIELELNLSPLNPPDKWNFTYVVSDTILDPTKWNDVYMTFNIPDKQISLTLKTQENPRGIVETFTLPNDFDWSFVDDWQSRQNWASIDEVDNNLNLFSGSGSGSFYGELDWIYAGNGVLDPIQVESKTGGLELVEVEPEVRNIVIDKDGYVASVVLGERDYEAWKNGGFVACGVRNDLLRSIYQSLNDDFDFILILSNENTSDLKYAGMYVAITNDVEGIYSPSFPNPLFDLSASSGSKGRLQGAIHFPVKGGIEGGPSLHEIAHRWANFSLNLNSLAEIGVSASDAMMPAGSIPHWGVSSVNGQLGGFALSSFEELGEGLYQANPFGTFANGGNRLPYSSLELYLMGMIPEEEVEDIVSFSGLSATNGQFFDSNQWSATQKVITTSDDLVSLLGERKPNYLDSQKAFKSLVLVITDKPLTQDEESYFSAQSQGFEDTFAWATGYRATMEMGNLGASLK